MTLTRFEPAHLLQAAVDCERCHMGLTRSGICLPDLLRNSHAEITVLRAKLWEAGLGKPHGRADYAPPPVAEAVTDYDIREAQGMEP